VIIITLNNISAISRLPFHDLGSKICMVYALVKSPALNCTTLGCISVLELISVQ